MSRENKACDTHIDARSRFHLLTSTSILPAACAHARTQTRTRIIDIEFDYGLCACICACPHTYTKTTHTHPWHFDFASLLHTHENMHSNMCVFECGYTPPPMCGHEVRMLYTWYSMFKKQTRKLWINTCVCACTLVCTYICTRLHVYMHTHIYIYIHAYVCLFVYM